MINRPCKFNDSPAGILSVLDTSEFNFFETGSRFFKTASINSDWDFFVEDSNAVIDFLNLNGFYQSFNCEHYGDVACSSIFEGNFDGKIIHVQIVDSAWMEIKKKAHEVIVLHNYHLVFKSDKVLAKAMWSVIMRTLYFKKLDKS